MELVGAWTRQVARAAGASLIAPLVLLLAAGVVASGGGVGGIGSLGQIASGPALPDTGLTAASDASLEGAEIVGADLPTPAVEPTPSAPSAVEVASAAPVTSVASPAPTERGPSIRTSPGAGPQIRTPETPLTDTGGGPRVPVGRPAPGANAVEEIEDTTRGLGEALPVPLRPIANELLDLLLGPPPSR